MGKTTSSTAASSRKKFPQKKVGAASTKCPCPLRIHIHLDANRDGEVDDDWTQNGIWSPGKGKLGAVVLCNVDDEDGDKKEDHTNEKIDGADDNSDIAPFHLRKHPKDEPAPKGWKVKVEVIGGLQRLFRIFNNEKAAGTELLGPKTKHFFELKDLSPNEWKYGMEVNQYAGRLKKIGNPRDVEKKNTNWNGYVRVKLSLIDDKDIVRDSETAKIRCAPWVIYNHMDPTEKGYVVDTGDNGPFVGELKAAAGVPFHTFSDADRWMQDVMEIGFSTLPKKKITEKDHLPAVLRTATDRGRRGMLDTLIKTDLIGKNFGYYEAVGKGAGSSLDSFGNLECVPPFKHPKTGVDYKFGRIIYGHGGGGHTNMQEEITEFLHAQKVQFPFDVDTSWLLVGHIDEVLTFVPTPAGKFGFKAVFAGPKLALDMISRRATPTGPRVATIPVTTPALQGIRNWASVAADYPYRTVADLLDVSVTPNIVEASEVAQTKIDTIRAALDKYVGLPPADILELPVLFQQDGYSKCVAYTAGSVNMLVVSKGSPTRRGVTSAKLCIPRPFGPVVGGACIYEAAMTRTLSLAGVSFAFIDDFETYHALQGEIHCGSNSLRKGAIDRFWWEQAGI